MKRIATTLLLAAFAAGCQHSPTAPSAPPATLTVACYNIRIGAGPTGPFEAANLEPTMNAIADWIIASDADIVLLQEVDVATTRAKGMDQVAFLAGRTGFQPAWGKAQDLAGGGYGIAVLSRYPVRDVTVHRLFKPDYSVSHPQRPAWYGEQRVALTLVADTPHGPVQVVNTHLGVTEDQRVKQLEQLAGIVKGLDASIPVVLGGDLNAEPGEASLQPVRALLTDGWSAATEPADRLYTFSATKPERTIDYLFFSGHLAVKSITVPSVQHSDHLPVLATVEVRKP